MHVYPDGDPGITGLSWSHDSKHLITSGPDAKIIDTQTGQIVASFPTSLTSLSTSPFAAISNLFKPLGGLGVGVMSSAWSPDDTQIVSALAGNDGSSNYTEIAIWNAATGQFVRSLEKNTRGLSYNLVAWSPDGKFIAAAGDKINGNKITVWNTQTNQLVSTNTDHKDTVTDLSWSPDSQMVASSSMDDKTIITSASTGKIITSHTGGGGKLAWSPDGKHIATVIITALNYTSDKDIEIFDTTTGQTSYTYTDHGSAKDTYIYGLAWSPDGKFIASGDDILSISIAATTATPVGRSHSTGSIPTSVPSSSSSTGHVKVWSAQ